MHWISFNSVDTSMVIRLTKYNAVQYSTANVRHFFTLMVINEWICAIGLLAGLSTALYLSHILHSSRFWKFLNKAYKLIYWRHICCWPSLNSQWIWFNCIMSLGFKHRWWKLWKNPKVKYANNWTLKWGKKQLSHHRGKVLFLSRPIRFRLMVVEEGTASRWWELLGNAGTHWLLFFAFCSLSRKNKKTTMLRGWLQEYANT